MTISLSPAPRRKSPRRTKEMSGGEDLPMYQLIKEDMQGSIRLGRLKPGQRVPSESELIAQYRVSNTTARRCLDEMEAAGWLERKRGKGTYVSQMAETLHQQRVALVVKDLLSLAHPFLATVVGTLEQSFDSASVHSVILRAKPQQDPASEGLRLVEELEHAGINYAVILSNLPLKMLLPCLDRGIRCLGVNTRYLDPRVPSIGNHFEAGMDVAIRELAKRGHRRLAVLTEESAMREVGTLNSASLLPEVYAKVRADFPHLEPDLIVREVGRNESIAHVTGLLANLRPRPTAFLCWDELGALHVMRTLKESQIRVPEDVSIVASKLLPTSPIACVELPLEDMAQSAASALLGWMKGREPASRMLPPIGFSPRETIASAPSA